MIFSADGLQWSADEAMMVMGLKGLVGIEIELTGPKGDQHSGLWWSYPKRNGIKSPYCIYEK